MLEEELGAGEESHSVARRAWCDGCEVLETGNLRDEFFDARSCIGFFFEEEHAVVVHWHRFGRGHGVGFGVVVSGVFDCLTDAEDPGGDFSRVISFGLECVLVRRIGKATEDNRGTCF